MRRWSWWEGKTQASHDKLKLRQSVPLISIYTQYTHTQHRQTVFPCNVESTLMRAGQVLTAGWSLPRVFSLMANASLRRFAASLYLFWSLESGKHFHINLLRLVVQQRSFSQESVSMATGWWHNSLISQRLVSRILP